MGMKLTFNNFFSFISYITPFLVTFYIISIGLMQGGTGVVKSSLYVAGVMLVLIVASFLQTYIAERGVSPADPLCNLFDIPFIDNSYVVPTISTTIISFSLCYLLFPMINSGDYKFGLLGFLSLLLLINIVTSFARKCSTFMGLVSGLITGAGIAGLYTWGISFDNSDLLFFRNPVSNNVTCSQPTNQTFKCAVYKNGKIIQNL